MRSSAGSRDTGSSMGSRRGSYEAEAIGTSEIGSPYTFIAIRSKSPQACGKLAKSVSADEGEYRGVGASVPMLTANSTCPPAYGMTVEMSAFDIFSLDFPSACEGNGMGTEVDHEEGFQLKVLCACIPFSWDIRPRVVRSCDNMWCGLE